MKPHGTYRIADMTVMLAVVSVSLATWACPSDSTGIAVWKSYVSVGMAVFLALAASTRHPGWAVAARFLLGAWMIAAPYAFGFTDLPPAGAAYPAIGVLVIMTSMLGYKALLHNNRYDLRGRARP